MDDVNKMKIEEHEFMKTSYGIQKISEFPRPSRIILILETADLCVTDGVIILNFKIIENAKIFSSLKEILESKS